MLWFDPTERITVPAALEHPWLSAYHDPEDEPDCPKKFEKWREIEGLETLEEFREALWREIEDYRREVRGISLSALPPLSMSPRPLSPPQPDVQAPAEPEETAQPVSPKQAGELTEASATTLVPDTSEFRTAEEKLAEAEDILPDTMPSLSPEIHHRRSATASDPVVTYARRSSILQPSRQGSTYSSPLPANFVPAFAESAISEKAGQGTVAFPTQGYVVPARSRTGSTVGGEVTRRLLRTLSTVSIHESGEGLAGGLAGIAPIAKYITAANTEADAPPSEVTKDFGITSDAEDDTADAKAAHKSAGRFTVP